MSKIDQKTSKVLDFIRNKIRAMPHGEKRSLAKACGIDAATITHLMDTENYPNYHPKVGTVLRILSNIIGTFPLEIKNNNIVSELVTINTEDIFVKFAKEVIGLANDDIELLFQFLAILKNRKELNPQHVDVLAGALSMLQEELIRKKGKTVLFNFLSEKERGGIQDELN